jgi:predicted KAP-like P-loop ATPase
MPRERGTRKKPLLRTYAFSIQAPLSDEHRPLILEFNPWQWASPDKIAESFFREV